VPIGNQEFPPVSQWVLTLTVRCRPILPDSSLFENPGMPMISRVVPLDRFSRVKYLAQYYRESGMIPMKDRTISIKGHSFRNCKVFLARVGVFNQRNSHAHNPLERVSASDRASNPEGFVVVSICFPRQRLPPLEQEPLGFVRRPSFVD
jgi:hypothetical protein